MGYTNHDIVTAALRGKNAATSTGNMSTDHYREGFTRYGAPYSGQLPPRLSLILDERFRAGAISQVIYSYSTPIAWLDGDTWVIPAVSYSITTSTKHQSQLYRLFSSVSVNLTVKIPYDCGQDEYLRYVSGQMAYRNGRTVPGPAFVLN